MQTEITIFIVTVNIVILLLIGGIVLFIIQYRKRRLAYNQEKQEIGMQHQKEILATQLEVQTQTMQYIGREIHDSVGQKLTLASLYTQQLAYENKAPQVTDKIESIGHIINESLAELRQLSKTLTDDHIAKNNIAALVEQECAKVNELKKCRVSFSSNESAPILSYQEKNIVLRIVQEFLQNSIKHSNCKTITVVMKCDTGKLSLLLKDDGIGFNPGDTTSSGIGLMNMKKRIAFIGGRLSLQTEPGKGTAAEIYIPLNNQTAAL